MRHLTNVQAEIHVGDAANLAAQFFKIRHLTVGLISQLSEADATLQSMPETSPAKWHLGHTTWFFETFVLTVYLPTYELFDDRFSLIFNNQDETSEMLMGKPSRGVLSRPSLESVLCYRDHVDEAITNAIPALPNSALKLIELGCNHEQQHQEQMLTDLLHLFSLNPLHPTVWPSSQLTLVDLAQPFEWVEGESGLIGIGHRGPGFAFDYEAPKHLTMVHPHAIANRLVTNGEWMNFMDDGGYLRPEYWLSTGWAWAQQNTIQSPLYWHKDKSGRWARQYQLDGLVNLDTQRPVQHISYYEADAFARWAGARLPTEFEWESAAQQLSASHGNFLDEPGPVKSSPAQGQGLLQMFGDAWEWTSSSFAGYPGFCTNEGAVSEHSGKLMSGQYVLRGGSCATPRGHVRPTYRNFLYPHQRWQFTGLRLAKNLSS